ncbi:hypothetical protein FOCC_FOCC005437 [Frankliniella occidentalis]|nr:hypothetical protein FOCC_FOCC005437 [Frankliniella occidentalis]
MSEALFPSYDDLKGHRREEHGSTLKEFIDLENEDDAKMFYEQLLLESGHASSVEERLQLKAAELLHKMYEYTTQTVIDSVIKGVDVLSEIDLDLLQNKFCQMARNSNSNSLSLDEICKTLDGYRHSSLFEGLQTRKKYEKYLDQKKWLVPPKQVVLSEQEVLRKTNSVEKIPVEFGYSVGFLLLLEKLLNLPEVLHCIDNPKLAEEGTFASPLDGYYYRNHPVVKKFPGQTLAFGTYVDDARLTDTASTSPLNGRFFYWNLLNLYPELRSSTRAINLMFCAQAEYIKNHGFDKFLEDYVEGIKKLSSDEGVNFLIMGKVRTFHGIHLFSSGDNPASANLGGFKESHFADLLCRQCLGTKPEIYKSFLENSFSLRSKESHKKHIEELEAFLKLPSNQQLVLKNPSVSYGVNSRSIFMFEGCDVTKQFPQDLMHDVIHGTLKLEIICLIDHAVNKIEPKLIDLKTVNNRIKKYSKYFGVNKPSAIEAVHLKNENLRTSASETLALANMLPFVLLDSDELSSSVKSVCHQENLNCFILRLNLLNLQMATQFTVQDVENLRKMTNNHHKMFLKCYPGSEIPKMHYEIHLPTQILLFGPLRQHWCFRFESKQAEFKRVWKISHNSVNVYHSLAWRHQTKQAGDMMLSVEGDDGPYLKTANCKGVPKSKKIGEMNEKHQQMLLEVFSLTPPNVTTFDKYEYIVVKGVHYAARDVFVLDFLSGVPVLGEILSIYGHGDLTALIYAKIVTENYEANLNAFKVKQSGELGVALTTQIKHHQSVPYIKSINSSYVIITCKSFLSVFVQ